MDARESSVSFPALGTTAVVAVTDPEALVRAREVVEGVIAAFDRACSRFRGDSELSAVNDAAGTAVRVGPLMVEAVGAALRAARLTDGDVDPTVGRMLIALGYDQDFEQVAARPSTAVRPDAASIALATVPGWRTVQLDSKLGTVRVPEGVALDLGATAKALAADHAAAAASSEAGGGVLVSLGGDLAIAGPAPSHGWRVLVTDDHRADLDAPGQWITLRSGGLATSSTTVRRWRTRSGPVHHLLDPSTGRPAGGIWRTASVAAASCLDANIASTAAIIRGERAVAWLESLRLPSRLVGVDGTARHLGGWPEAGDDLSGSGTTT